MPAGLLLAAPSSGAGKTFITLALLAAIRDRGIAVAGAKSGPDYIDPAFHAAATGRPAVNLDAWAMDHDTLRARARGVGADLMLVEGAMGALDGAGRAGSGSAADLAQALDIPIVLIVDAAKKAQSVVLSVAGLRALRPEIRLAGVILNRVRSARHEGMARAALEGIGVACFGAIPAAPDLHMPERHLGLVQAVEHPDLQGFFARAAALAATHCDLDALMAAAGATAPSGTANPLKPLGNRIAIARDEAFTFIYQHMLDDWRAEGAELSFFSPLADEAPDASADSLYLPGGYPELHASRLAAASRFREGVLAAAKRGARIYGECGGYMVLGQGLVDVEGVRHQMLGLLPVETSFAERRLTLGYRQLTPLADWPPGPVRAHEFHYATVTSEEESGRLFKALDADVTPLPAMGHRRGNVSGSFAHVIA